MVWQLAFLLFVLLGPISIYGVGHGVLLSIILYQVQVVEDRILSHTNHDVPNEIAFQVSKLKKSRGFNPAGNV